MFIAHNFLLVFTTIISLPILCDIDEFMWSFVLHHHASSHQGKPFSLRGRLLVILLKEPERGTSGMCSLNSYLEMYRMTQEQSQVKHEASLYGNEGPKRKAIINCPATDHNNFFLTTSPSPLHLSFRTILWRGPFFITYRFGWWPKNRAI